ncbi:hypothetical protein CMI37_30555 [Candidatus Pacearchaeota archaeon]|nr:hypothetical protein [Candidatus Pacearchaeota archaeon]|tara:strand:- start:4015 stop:4485 length:471 start_codon:yes stop_codon:yes gene_type:complete
MADKIDFLKDGTPFVINNVHNMDNDMLLRIWEDRSARIDLAMKDKGHIEMELTRRMNADNSTQIPNPYFEVKLGTPSYDYSRLKALAELVSSDEYRRGYTPAHEETKKVHVPERFDMRVVNAWNKYGSAIQEAIQYAELPLSRRITIHSRELKQES